MSSLTSNPYTGRNQQVCPLLCPNRTQAETNRYVLSHVQTVHVQTVHRQKPTGMSSLTSKLYTGRNQQVCPLSHSNHTQAETNRYVLTYVQTVHGEKPTSMSSLASKPYTGRNQQLGPLSRPNCSKRQIPTGKSWKCFTNLWHVFRSIRPDTKCWWTSE
jgi:hypothetical protein